MASRRRSLAVAAYWWMAGQFSRSTVEYVHGNPQEFEHVPKPVKAALPLLFGAAWPLVVVFGLPNSLRKELGKLRLPEPEPFRPRVVKP
jgi:hypothetical protein